MTRPPPFARGLQLLNRQVAIGPASPALTSATQGGRHEQAFRPARGPFRTGPYGPGPVENLVGPGCNFRPEKLSVRSGL